MTPVDNGQAALKGKRLLILDGSRKAIEIIDHARKLGVETVVTDRNDPKDSPAKLAADEYFNVSTADVDAVVNLIEHEDIAGVLPGFSDRWLPVYATIADQAGLPRYASREQLELFTDKARYRQLLEKHGVPTTAGINVEDALAGRIAPSDFPVLIKPSDGSGSRGIAICNTPAELGAGLRVALDYSWTGDLVVERFTPGEEATVFWTFQDGEYFVSMLANRHMLTFNNGKYRLPVGYTSPSHLIPQYLAEVAPKVRNMLKDAGIKNGVMFMQGLVDQGTFRTYDIGYRLTPTQEYRMMEKLQGYNPLSMMVRFAVTGNMGEPDLAQKANPLHEGFAYNVSTLSLPGTIARIEGLEEVRRLADVLSVATATSEGESLPPEALGQLRQIVVRTIGTASTEQGLAEVITAITDAVSIYDPSGKQLSLPGLSRDAFEWRLL